MDKKIDHQNKFIMAKYNYSENIYMNTYIDESIYIFLNDFDDMNVYSMYPEMVVLDIDKDKNIDLEKIIDLKKEFNNEDFDYRSNKLKNIYIKINNKLKEFEEFNKDKKKLAEYIKQYKATGQKLGRIRKYFSYEVIDYAVEVLEINPVTNAWLKCYELLTYFDIIPKKSTDTFNSFHICELPGTFILATNHYIKTKTTIKEFNWNAQSLNPWTTKEKGKFLPDQYGMAKKYKDRYHWAVDGTGDITKVINILFYQNQFKNMDFVTSDCGQDSSEDFTMQEHKLNRVMFSQFVCAVGMLKKGGNYIAKIFTIQTKKMIEMIYICTTLFDKVYIVKPLKTKPTSGERYLVCMGFNNNNNKLIDILINYLRVFDKRDSLIDMNKISNKFIDRLNNANNIMGYRRITSINQSIFQVKNFKYINEHDDIYIHNKKMVDYYVDYFMQYYKLEKLDNKDRMLDPIPKKKWN